jgi:hypothetical protein
MSGTEEGSHDESATVPAEISAAHPGGVGFVRTGRHTSGGGFMRTGGL